MESEMLLDKLSAEDNAVGFFAPRGRYLVVATFDPWTGIYLPSSYESRYVGVLCNEFNGKERGNKRAIKKRVFQIIEENKQKHNILSVCPAFYDLVIGVDKGTTRVAYLPMIRSYVVFRKGEKGQFDAMDYCPFCGAKLPQRLDDALGKILQDEYGLSSWRDYKKAPHEFHTDEWWKKRGL